MQLFYDTSVLNAEEKEKLTKIVNRCLESFSEEMLKESLLGGFMSQPMV